MRIGLGEIYRETRFSGCQSRHEIDGNHHHFFYSGNIVHPKGVLEADVYTMRVDEDYWRILQIQNREGGKQLNDLEILIEKKS